MRSAISSLGANLDSGAVQLRLKDDDGQVQHLKYLAGYSEQLITQAGRLLAENRLGSFLKQKYPTTHDIRTDKALYDFTVEIKNAFLRTAQPLSRVVYDPKIHVIQNALGTHTFVSRVQGGKLKAKHEIRVATVFRSAEFRGAEFR